MAQRFLEGDKDPAPAGWMTLADMFSLLLRERTPLEIRPCPYERFTPENLDPDGLERGRVPKDVGTHGLLAAAVWSVCERLGGVALLGSDGQPRAWRKVLVEPRSSFDRWDMSNEHLNLCDGRIGTGCDAARRPIPPERTKSDFGDLEGASVLLPSAAVASALAEFGLAEALPPELREVELDSHSAIGARAGRPPKKYRAAAVIAKLYPPGSARPTKKEMARTVGDALGEPVGVDTIYRAIKLLECSKTP